MSGYQSSMPLFDRPREGPASIPLNSTVEEQDAPRLSRQQQAILAALREGPKTNIELGKIAQRFSARLREIKRAGHPWLRKNIGPGVNEYRLLQ